jgi:hypothetical protein
MLCSCPCHWHAGATLTGSACTLPSLPKYAMHWLYTTLFASTCAQSYQSTSATPPQVVASCGPEVLPVLYTKSIAVDLLAVTSAWCVWVLGHTPGLPQFVTACERAHKAAALALTDELHAAAAAADRGSLQLAPDPYGMERGELRMPFSVHVARGVVVAGYDADELEGVAVEALHDCPWAAAAAEGALLGGETARLVPSLLLTVMASSAAFSAAAATASACEPGVARGASRRICRSPAAVPLPSDVAADAFASMIASPGGAADGIASDAREATPFGTLSPRHPMLRPIVLTAPGVAICSMLPNEAQQHLTLTQQDGSEPQWRGTALEALTSSLGYATEDILDSRLGAVAVMISPLLLATRCASPFSDVSSAGIPAVPPAVSPTPAPTASPVAELHVCTLNGCAINGRAECCGARVPLHSGDVITLTSATPDGSPPLEFTFTSGNPKSRCVPPHPAVAATLPPVSVYAIPLCQLCASPPRACVELQPCGHNFCAACLSHYFADALASATPLACPHGCADTTSIAPCSSVDALLDGLPSYIDRLTRVIAWGHGSDPSGGDAATPTAGTPRSPIWATADGEHLPLSPFAGAARRLDGGFASAPRSPAMRHGSASSLSLSSPHHPSHPPSMDPHAPLSPVTYPRVTDRPPPHSPSSAAHPHHHHSRPDSCSPVVPLEYDMLPLSMQALHSQQGEVSARYIKSGADGGPETLPQTAAHLCMLAHGAVASQVSPPFPCHVVL